MTKRNIVYVAFFNDELKNVIDILKRHEPSFPDLERLERLVTEVDNRDKDTNHV